MSDNERANVKGAVFRMNKKASSLVLLFAVSTLIGFGSIAVRGGVTTSVPHRAKTLRHPHLATRLLIAPRVWKQGSRPPEVSELTWRPDGKWAAYFLDEGRENVQDWNRISLCCIRADGKQVRRLYARKGIEPQIAAWSPDGRRILFWELEAHASSVNADGSPLYDVSVMGGNTRLLTTPFQRPDGVWDKDMMRKSNMLIFSPDGKYLLLVRGIGRNDTLNKQLVRVAYPAGTQRRLTEPNIAAVSPIWSQDSKHIAFLACPDRLDQHLEWQLAHRHLWIMDSDGLHQYPLTTDSRYQELDPRWLPDRRTIRFTRQENNPEGNGNTSAWEIHADGTGLRRTGNLMR